MPRSANKETRLMCNHCKDLTPSINPIIIIKESDKIYRMSAYCGKCKNYKPAKILNPTQIKLLPQEIKSATFMKVFVNQIEREGGAIPFGLLIPLITGAIQAIPEIAKTVSNLIKGNGTSVDEEELINIINASSPVTKSKILSGLGINKLGFSIINDNFTSR